MRANNRNALASFRLLNSKLDLMSEFSISFLRILCDYAAIAIQNSRSMKLIQELSITDDCTGLFNARHLYSMLDEQVQLAARAEQSKDRHQFSLLFVDLDRFKNVNDTHGSPHRQSSARRGWRGDEAVHRPGKCRLPLWWR